MDQLNQQAVVKNEFPNNSKLSFLYHKLIEILNNSLVNVDIRVNGERDTDLIIYNSSFIDRGMLALIGFDPCFHGETYMRGDWDVKNLGEFAYKLALSDFYKNYYTKNLSMLRHTMIMKMFNHQNKDDVKRDVPSHYDLGTELYEHFLDKNMNYSCGYWRNARNLDEAQINKMNLIGRKLKLKKGMQILDIGCGYGSLAKYLSETWDVEVLGLTLSRDQLEYANKHFKSEKVKIKLMDYRELINDRKIRKDMEEKVDGDGPDSYIGYFDRVVSVGMFEHVGHKNYRQFFEIAHKMLKDDSSIFLLHTIGLNHDWIPCVEPWLNAYIFPNGMIPYCHQITSETRGLLFLEDWHNFGHDYSATLLAWYDNFERNWPKIRALLFEKKRLAEKDERTKIHQNLAKNKVSSKMANELQTQTITKDSNVDSNIDDDIANVFFRMWKFYLLFSAGYLKARRFNLWQVVFTKNGLPGGYLSER